MSANPSDNPPLKRGRFIQLPMKLADKLSDPALRLLTYAMDREGLVKTGKLLEWHLSRAAFRIEYGISDYSSRKAFGELRKLKVLTSNKYTYDTLNTEELEKWYNKEGVC